MGAFITDFDLGLRCINVSFLVFCTETLHLKMMQLNIYRCRSIVVFPNIRVPHLTNRQKFSRVMNCKCCTVHKNLNQFAVDAVSSQTIKWIDLVEKTHRFSELHVLAIWCYIINQTINWFLLLMWYCNSNHKLIPFTLIWMKLT